MIPALRENTQTMLLSEKKAGEKQMPIIVTTFKICIGKQSKRYIKILIWDATIKVMELRVIYIFLKTLIQIHYFYNKNIEKWKI